jgi:DNA-directed RNA polymerase specialized sigma subunit
MPLLQVADASIISRKASFRDNQICTKSKFLERLNIHQTQVSRRHFAGKRRQLQDVASLYGISPQSASQIVKAAVAKLHKALAA